MYESGTQAQIFQTGGKSAFEGSDGSDARLHGTIRGDQVHFSQSEERGLQGLKVDLHTEIRGTVLDEDRMVLTQESETRMMDERTAALLRGLETVIRQAAPGGGEAA